MDDMIQSLFDIVREWNAFAQVVSLVAVSGLMTLVVLALIGFVGEFINVTLPVLIRGYDPYRPKEDASKNTDTTEEM